jgi:hypothetical protein
MDRRFTTRMRRFALLIAALAVVSLGAVAAVRFARPSAVEGPGFRLEVVSRVRTGHQRAERLVFLEGGERLAVACPRYNRVVIYRITGDFQLVRERDLKLDGRPVALAATPSSLIVLQRPAGDARHVEEAWWDVFTPGGEPVGSRFRLGFDPDDLAVSPDGRTALVLRSGRAEGEWNRPLPSLLAVAIEGTTPRPLGAVDFTDANDDPERLAWDASSGQAVVALGGSQSVARIDFSDTDHPRLIERLRLPAEIEVPAGVAIASMNSVRVADSAGGGLWEIGMDGAATGVAEGIREFAELAPSRLIGASAQSGALEVWESGTCRARLALAGLGEFQPMGLAVADRPGGRLIAVSDRSGAVCLVRMVEAGR